MDKFGRQKILKKNLGESKGPGGITGWLEIMGILKLDYQSSSFWTSGLELPFFISSIKIQNEFSQARFFSTLKKQINKSKL